MRRGAPHGHRTLHVLFVVWLGAGCAPSRIAPAPDLAPAPTLPVCAQIFSTNDTHGRLLAAKQTWSEGRRVGGSAAIAGFVANARRETPACPLFIVSGGDVMQGTLISNLSDGASTIEALNLIGYDALAIGNHEFDWGVDVLKARVAQADFPMLGANIYLKGTDRHPAWVQPWTIVERGGVRIGFVGMTTRSTPTTARPGNVVDFDFRSIAEALDRYIPEVRSQGVDFVVAVMHAGAFCHDGDVCEGEAIDELNATSARFDYAVTGHTHSRVETRVKGVPVVQSFANTTAYGLGRLDREASGSVSAEIVEIRQAYADEVVLDEEITTLVEAYRGEVAPVMDRVVAHLANPLDKPRRSGFPLGRLIADAQRAETGTQVALMNNGGIRRPLPAGDIRYGDLFELQPFGNTLYRLELSGRGLLQALEHAVKDDGIDLQVSGLTVHYLPAAPQGSRIVAAFAEDGAPIEPEGRYTVTVNDFMATGGGGYTMFLEALTTEVTGIVDLDALVQYLERLPQPVSAPTAPRWIPSPPR